MKRLPPLFPVLLPVAWLLLLFYASSAPLFALWRPLLALGILALFVYGGLRLLLRSWVRASLWAGLVLSTVMAFWLAVLLLTVIGLWWLTLLLRRRLIAGRALSPLDFEPIAEGLNTLSVVVTGVILFNLAATGGFQQFSPGTGPTGRAPANAPNIYFVLLDGYPNPTTLAHELAFDESPFRRQMSDLGFEISDSARSNYVKTWLTLASTFSMQYVNELPSLRGLPHAMAQQLRALTAAVNNGQALEVLRAHGYRVVSGTSPFTDAGLRTADVVENDTHLTAFEDQLMRLTLFATLAPGIAREIAVNETAASTRDALARLSDWSTNGGQQPTFYFDHVLSPHPPLVFNSDGSLQQLPGCYPASCVLYEAHHSEMGITKAAYASSLRQQLTYLNQLVVGAAAKVVANDPSAVVVFFSDHGTRYDADDTSEYFKTLLAVRAPGHPGLAARMVGPVNYLGVILKAYLGVDFVPKPYQAWLSGELPLDLRQVH